jgi:PPOX class probable F420-dependent enzyme
MPILNAQARGLLNSGNLAHLVTLNADGSPHVSCVYVRLDGDEIVSAHLGEYRKVHNVRRDPRVALSVAQARSGDDLFTPYLVVNGIAEVVAGGAATTLREMSRAYFGIDFPPAGAPDGFVLRITPHSVHGIGPWRSAEAA